MALSAFDDKSAPPDETMLAAVLGDTAGLWDDLMRIIAETYPPVSETWNYSGKNYGWSFRMKQKKRTILYMIPRPGHFLVAFVLGDRAVAAARDSQLPPAIKDHIAAAKRYAEGTGFRFEVRSREDVAAAETLAAIKMAP